MRLSIDPRDGAVKLALPTRANLKKALAWVESQRDWIEAALARLPEPSALAHGALLPFEGCDYRVVWRPERGRTVAIEGEALVVGGPEAHLPARLLRWFKAEALARLENETRRFAERANVDVGRVAVGDARSRWGSCTASGDIRYSWRLVMAPPAVLEATVAHEVAHRLHMHHGPAFHRAVADLLGREPKAERAWLKTNGSRLQAIGRG